MGHARGARALREAIANKSDPETCAGVLAVQLNQLDDAEKMYEASGRYAYIYIYSIYRHIRIGR